MRLEDCTGAGVESNLGGAGGAGLLAADVAGFVRIRAVINLTGRRAMKKMMSALVIAAALVGAPQLVSAQAQKPGPMPEGKGKVLVEAVCGACHATSLIQNSSGYTRDHWKLLAAMMIDLSKQPDTQNEILDYLTTNFPTNTNRAAKAVPGTFEVKFT
jgi:cytochrome c5